ncbi:peptide transporter [Clostridium sp. D2Q-11]|uniref:Peptide transporter n=1 Tax=Anaeromonas frigoriresistens TaxID=2683708 RepID=A0A942UXI9_9FIRM|nr:peptide transporter [Anaeromonas frigoriresistens]MBS4538781.1 peptide transporter [Anaeromonas frigoriresistens]
MNLLKINDLTEGETLKIFDLADRLREQKTSNILQGKTFVLFFPETSLRTRVTFEKGISDLGGKTILFPPNTLDKKEKLEDVISYMENWVDGVIVRHKDYSTIEELAKYASIPIINAMTSENHPCEILSDVYSISRIRDNFTDLTYTFVGEEGNIFNSWFNISKLMNLNLHHISPNNDIELEDVLRVTDIILTDPLPSDLINDEYISKYQITLERMKLTKKNSLLNPCPPFFRNEEVSKDVIDSECFVGYEFKKNLIYVQQAIILWCLGIYDISSI